MPQGWLTALDFGEWGGWLSLVDIDQAHYKFISDRNTRLVAKTSKGLFAFQDLSHLQFSYADLVEVVPGPKSYSTRTVTTLHESPRAIWQDHDRFLFSTDTFISTLETDGSQRELDRFGCVPEFRSMTQCANGDVWLGGGIALLRIQHKGDGYAFDWFTTKTRAAKGDALVKSFAK